MSFHPEFDSKTMALHGDYLAVQGVESLPPCAELRLWAVTELGYRGTRYTWTANNGQSL